MFVTSRRMKNVKITVEALLESRLAELQASKLPQAARALLEAEMLSAVKLLIQRRVTPKLLGKVVARGLAGSKPEDEHKELSE